MSLISNNALLSSKDSYVGPPLIIQRQVASVNFGSISNHFPSTPDIGDFLVFFITAGSTQVAPNVIPAGLTLRSHIHVATDVMVLECYAGIADGITNTFTFGFASGGSIGLSGYHIRHSNNTFDFFNQNLAPTVTAMNCSNANKNMQKNSLALAAFTVHNSASGPIAFTNSFGNIQNYTPPGAPTRVGASADRTYTATATGQNTQASWTVNRTGISIFTSILAANPV